MAAAANNIYREGPNAERIALEKGLILSGPPVVKGPKIVGPKIVGEKKVGSGIPFFPDLTIQNMFKPKPYFSGGLITGAGSQKGLPSIPPPMSSNVQVEYVPIDAMKGNSPPVVASSYGGSDIPSFSASAPGPDYKRQTLGITA